MDSEMVKVDRKLFVTCRLCIEEMGVYQITPKVKYLIKFCFDIDVDPFDGLPQLICGSCATTLNEYYTKKRIFVGKQNALKANMEVRKDIAESAQKALEEKISTDKAEPQQDTVSSSQPNETTETTKPSSKPKKRRIRVITSSSSENECAKSFNPVVIEKNKKQKRVSNPSPEWADCYNKRYACRFCNKLLKTETNIKKHMRKHTNLIAQYSDILKRPLIIPLHKIDNQPNITGTHTATMLSRHKIITRSENGHNYATVYLLKEEIDKPSENDKSDSDDFNVKNSSKRPRLMSHSSIDTVVLDDNKNNVASDNEPNAKENAKDTDLECIYLDDSSNGSNENASSEGNYKIKSDDYKVIQNLISRCQSKYIQEHESFQSDLNQMTSKDFSSIKHKIINMGRKLINGPGLSSTGLLRYMEYSNLKIKWMPSKDLTYVRVMPFLKSKECASNNLKHTGWKDMTDVASEQDNILNNFEQKVKPKPKRARNTVTQKGVENTNAIIQNNLAPNRAPESDKKLLNANPVANPKQLPKKIGTETKYPVNASTSNAFYVEIPIELYSQLEEPPPPTCMPIITSTTSLAGSTSEINDAAAEITEKESAVENSIQVEKSTPRIKVKPVSELMSERALQSLGQQQTVDPSSAWNQNGPPANRNMMPVGRVSSEPCKMSPGSNMTESSRGFLILNTVELPNTKTDSPFKYVKNLLQMHDIILLDFHAQLPADLTCLIKFKLQFYKDKKLDRPVALCLSVHCSGNKFLLGVYDTISSDGIDLNKLSPNWQWEIIKIYTTKEDVIKKIRQNAEKISRETFTITNNFLCILKSIEHKTGI